jgi:hypothetical protein
MRTRGSIFYHRNEDTGVEIHIFEEVAIGVKNDIRLEIEFPHGVVNVPCPLDALVEELSQYRLQKG